MLSIIIPYCNEMSHLPFTIQSIVNSLRNANESADNYTQKPFEWEIITINNYCEKTKSQGFVEDGGSAYLDKLIEEKRTPYLKNIQYTEKLSHWNAKMEGVRASTGDVLLFLDAHVIVPHDNLPNMFYSYIANPDMMENASLHMTLSYLNDLPENKLIYRMRANPDIGLAHYVFHKHSHLEPSGFLEVPVMSTCGMLVSRKVFDKIGGWPKALHEYGGGENAFLYTGSVLGIKHYVWLGDPLQHYAAPRGYHYEMKHWLFNRALAAYLAGGEPWLFACKKGMSLAERAPDRVLRIMVEEILYNTDLENRRCVIEDNQVMSLEDFIASWEGNELYSRHHEWV